MTTLTAITSGQIDAESFIDTTLAGQWANNTLATLAGQWANNTLAISEGDASASAYRILIAALEDSIKPWVLIEEIEAASDATIDFEALGTYDRYMIVIDDGHPATDGVHLSMRVGTGGTPTYQTADYRYCTQSNKVDDVDDTFTQSNQTSTAQMLLTVSNSIGNAAPERVQSIITFSEPLNAVGDKLFKACTQHLGTTGIAAYSNMNVGSWDSQTAITAIRLYFSSGNVDHGKFSLYGLRL